MFTAARLGSRQASRMSSLVGARCQSSSSGNAKSWKVAVGLTAATGLAAASLFSPAQAGDTAYSMLQDIQARVANIEAQLTPPPAAPADYPPTTISDSIRKLPDWIQRGCGDDWYDCPEKDSTFAVDGKTPENMPDFTNHTSYMAETLKNNPGLWEELKDRATVNGVTLAQCIKCGVDNKGHPMIKIVGMTAGDAESYKVFKELFDPVISARHGGYQHRAGKQPTNLNIDELSTTDIDPYNSYVLTTRVRTGRSVKGFKFPPTIGFEERRKLEGLIVKGLMSMEGDLKGDYYPLNGSRSYDPKPSGMSHEKEGALRKMGNLFQEPDSTLLLSSGMARHWPDGRGVFHNDDANLFVWCNEEDHMRIVSMQGSRDGPSEVGKDIRATTARFIRACDSVQKVLKAEGADFVHDENLGWVLTCPSNLGTGLRAGTMVKLPKISARPDFKALCGKMGLQIRGTGGVDSTTNTGTWDISNSARIGKGEVDLVNDLIEGAAKLVKWEATLDGKEKGDAASVESEIQAILKGN